MSPKHLDRFVLEFADCHNTREQYSADQFVTMRDGMDNKRLRYKDLVKGNGLASGARSA